MIDRLYTAPKIAEQTTKTETYKRADATTYTLAVGPGTPSGPVDECTRTTEMQTLASHSCRGGGPNCASQYKSPTGVVKVGAFQKSEASGRCPRATSSGSAWNQVQQRTLTTYPAGAGGGTTTTAWAFSSYAQAGSWTYEYSTEEDVMYQSTCGADDKGCTKKDTCTGYDNNAMPW